MFSKVSLLSTKTIGTKFRPTGLGTVKMRSAMSSHTPFCFLAIHTCLKTMFYPGTLQDNNKSMHSLLLLLTHTL